MPRRRLLAVAVALLLLAVAGVTALTAELTRPLVHGWAETVGFGAGLVAAAVAVGVILRLSATGPTAPA